MSRARKSSGQCSLGPSRVAARSNAAVSSLSMFSRGIAIVPDVDKEASLSGRFAAVQKMNKTVSLKGIACSV